MQISSKLHLSKAKRQQSHDSRLDISHIKINDIFDHIIIDVTIAACRIKRQSTTNEIEQSEITKIVHGQELITTKNKENT